MQIAFAGSEYLARALGESDRLSCLQFGAWGKLNPSLEDGYFHFLPEDYGKCVIAIKRLNQAGRRYLIEDPGWKEKAVDVLNGVNDSIDCLFTHLKENPSCQF